MAQCYTIEHGSRTVGLACRIPGGFRFFATRPPYCGLDGEVFAQVRAIERAVASAARESARRQSA